MNSHPAINGWLMVGGGIISGVAAGYLILYGAITVAAGPLERNLRRKYN